VEVNHGLDLEVRLENLVMTGTCLSSNEVRVVVLYENRRESRFHGASNKGDDSTSERKSSMLMECRRRNV